ncbi:MAG: hypothetical protein V1820_06235 [archaeon]
MEQSRKVVFVSHCILNTNSRCKGGEVIHPSIVHSVVDWLQTKEIGIIQMPCQEYVFEGLNRDCLIFPELFTTEFRQLCRRIAEEQVAIAKNYLSDGQNVLAFVGIKGSPSCGINFTHIMEAGSPKRVAAKGIFFQELELVLKENVLEIPIVEYWRKGEEAFFQKMNEILARS